MSRTEPPEIMRVSQAVKFYGLSRNYIVDNLLTKKKMRCLRLDGYKLRIRRTEIENWIERNLEYYQKVRSYNPNLGKQRKRKETSHEQKD